MLGLTIVGVAFAAFGVWHKLRESARAQFDAAFDKHARAGLSHIEVERLCGISHWWLGRIWLARRFFAAACAYRGFNDEQRVRDAEAWLWSTGEDRLDPAHRRRDVSLDDDAMLWRRGRELLAPALRRRRQPLALDFERLGANAPLCGFDWRATTIAENTFIECQALRGTVLRDVRSVVFAGCDLRGCKMVGVLHCREVSFRACLIPDDFWEDVEEYGDDWYDLWLVDGGPPTDSASDPVMPTGCRVAAAIRAAAVTDRVVMRQRRALARELLRRRAQRQRAE